MKLRNLNTNQRIQTFLTVPLIAIALVGCGDEKLAQQQGAAQEKPKQESNQEAKQEAKQEAEAFFAKGLKSIKGAKVAELTPDQLDTLEQLRSKPETDFAPGNQYINNDQLYGYGPKDFRNLREFLISTARSASQPGQDESRTKSFQLSDVGECMPYQAEENPELVGSVEPQVKTSIDYQKSVSITEANQTREEARFKADGSYKVVYENCRNDNWDVRRNILIGLGYQEPNSMEIHDEMNRLYQERDEMAAIYAAEELDAQLSKIDKEIASLRETHNQLQDDWQAGMEVISADLVNYTSKLDGTVEGDFKVDINVKAIAEERQSFYEMEPVDWDEKDVRFKESLEDIEGTLRSQSSVEGALTVGVFDEETNEIVNRKVSSEGIILAVEISPLDLGDLQSLMVNDILGEEAREREIRDIIESSLKCSGKVTFDDGSEFDCAELEQYSLEELFETLGFRENAE